MRMVYTNEMEMKANIARIIPTLRSLCEEDGDLPGKDDSKKKKSAIITTTM